MHLHILLRTISAQNSFYVLIHSNTTEEKLVDNQTSNHAPNLCILLAIEGTLYLLYL